MVRESEILGDGQEFNSINGSFAHKAVILNSGVDTDRLVYGVGVTKNEATSAAVKLLGRFDYFKMNILGDLKKVELQEGEKYRIWGEGGRVQTHGSTDGLNH